MGKRDFQSESFLNLCVKRIIFASRTLTRCLRIKIITEANKFLHPWEGFLVYQFTIQRSYKC